MRRRRTVWSLLTLQSFSRSSVTDLTCSSLLLLLDRRRFGRMRSKEEEEVEGCVGDGCGDGMEERRCWSVHGGWSRRRTISNQRSTQSIAASLTSQDSSILYHSNRSRADSNL